MALIKLELPPGLVRVGTIYQTIGRWYDASLVRWHEGAMQPIGGWIQRTASAMTGKARAMVTWVANDTTRWIAIGTHSNLYIMSQTTDTPIDITPAGFTAGDADATAGAGYGIGDYGADEYGTPRIDNATYQEASMWTLDTFGELLYGMMAADGNLYKWSPPNTGTVAALASVNAPTGAAIVVTEERFIFVLGADGDARTVAWPDQESDSTWSPSATNQAGSYVIETQGKLMCGKRIRGGTLIFTDTDVHLATYVAQPYIYSFQRVGESCGICSRGAAVSTGRVAFWMGTSHFYMFDGAFREIHCDVHDAVFGDFNRTQASKVVAHHEPQFSEVWWFFPSAGSTENDMAVAYNYAEGFWMLHTLARTAAAPRGVFNNALMCDADGDVWDHETGSDYDGSAAYAESGPYELGDGERSMRVRAFVADEQTTADVSVSFKVRDWPGDSETTYGPYTPDGRTPARFSGRQARIRIDGVVETSWRWGNPRVEVLPGAKRWAA